MLPAEKRQSRRVIRQAKEAEAVLFRLVEMIQEASDEQPLDWSSVLTLAQSVEYHLLVIRDLATNVSKAVPHV